MAYKDIFQVKLNWVCFSPNGENVCMAELEHGNNLAHLESLFQMTTADCDRT